MTKEKEWEFNKEMYQEKLIKSCPVDNFFMWCYTTLRETENIKINQRMFFNICNLMFQDLFQNSFIVTFGKKKSRMKLVDSAMECPDVKIVLRKPQ